MTPEKVLLAISGGAAVVSGALAARGSHPRLYRAAQPYRLSSAFRTGATASYHVCLAAFCVLEQERHDRQLSIYKLKQKPSFQGRSLALPTLERLQRTA